MLQKNNTLRNYTELSRLQTFEERFEYLRLDGMVGVATFGFDRYLNQIFYNTLEWKQIRDHIIVRDHGCDLGMLDREIVGRIILHHMNPISKDDILERTKILLDPEFLICTFHMTHNAIHYGDSSLLPKEPVERRPNDTCPWKQQF